MKMRSLVVFTTITACFAVASSDIVCYSSSSSESELPSKEVLSGEDRKKQTAMRWKENPNRLQEPTHCYKVYSQVTSTILGVEDTAVSFRWGISLPRYTKPKQDVWSCTDVVEATEVDNFLGLNETIYTRQCLCCGNLCNGREMNDQCNQKPEFTKQCYFAGFANVKNTDGILPSNAKVVPATRTQYCYKATYYDTDIEKYANVWGATSLSRKERCGREVNIWVGPYLARAYICCDSLCDGPPQVLSPIDKASGISAPGIIPLAILSIIMLV